MKQMAIRWVSGLSHPEHKICYKGKLYVRYNKQSLSEILPSSALISPLGQSCGSKCLPVKGEWRGVTTKKAKESRFLLFSMCPFLVHILHLSSPFFSLVNYAIENNHRNKYIICVWCVLVCYAMSKFKLHPAVFQTSTAVFELPANVTSDGSKCDNTSSTLKLNFGEGHSWSVQFVVSGNTYRAENITFSYNLNDTAFFPKSTSNGNSDIWRICKQIYTQFKKVITHVYLNVF